MDQDVRLVVNFVRLLASCERLMAEDKNKRSTENRKKIQKFVGVMERQLAALRGEGHGAHGTRQTLPRETAAEYVKRVAEVSNYAHHQTRGSHQNELRARLFELHTSPRTSELPLEEADSAVDMGRNTANGLSPISDRSPPRDTQASELRYRGHRRANGVDGKETGVGVRALTRRESGWLSDRESQQSNSLSRSESEFSGNHEAELDHQSVTEDMLHIVSQLKDNSLNLSSILKDDSSRLEELDSHTESNLHKIRNENQSLQKQLSSSSSNTLWFWIIMIMVALVFVWMVIFIKMFPKR